MVYCLALSATMAHSLLQGSSTTMLLNGIKHTRTSPYHPSSNGLAERCVQTFKQAMESSSKEPGTMKRKLAKFLMAYRNTQHCPTQETSAKLMIGRGLKTRLHLLRPDIERHVKNQQEEMCRQRKAQNQQFENEQSVVVRDYIYRGIIG